MLYDIDITSLWDNKFTQIDTPDGVQNIGSIVKKHNKRCYALLFSNGDIIECSDSHLIQSTNGWISAEHIEPGTEVLSRDPRCVFLEKHYLGEHDVYDLEVLHENHRYWSENISSHNTGKSSTANAILKEYGCEALWINASIDKGIDILRGKIAKFASQSSFDDKLKVVVMDECDHFSKDGQAAFRGFIDEYSSNCRFIFTGNYKEKIIDPLLDRLEVYDYNSFPKKVMVKPIFELLQFILNNEKIQYDQKDLVPVINTYYPRIRSMIGAIQKFSKSGVLVVNETELDDVNVYDKVMQAFISKQFEDIIQAVNELNSPDNMYTFLYKNAQKYFEKNFAKAIVIIAKYQHMSDSVRDKNLNLAACMFELSH